MRQHRLKAQAIRCMCDQEEVGQDQGHQPQRLRGDKSNTWLAKRKRTKMGFQGSEGSFLEVFQPTESGPTTEVKERLQSLFEQKKIISSESVLTVKRSVADRSRRKT